MSDESDFSITAVIINDITFLLLTRDAKSKNFVTNMKKAKIQSWTNTGYTENFSQVRDCKYRRHKSDDFTNYILNETRNNQISAFLKVYFSDGKYMYLHDTKEQLETTSYVWGEILASDDNNIWPEPYNNIDTDIEPEQVIALAYCPLSAKTFIITYHENIVIMTTNINNNIKNLSIYAWSQNTDLILKEMSLESIINFCKRANVEHCFWNGYRDMKLTI